MKDALGGGSLLYIVVIFMSIIVLLFAGIMSYTKAYRVKNRIIEIIDRYGYYSNDVAEDKVNVEQIIAVDLRTIGYTTANVNQLKSKCSKESEESLSTRSFLYCIEKKGDSYKVTTFINFNIPIIGDTLVFPVKGETKILGKDYNY